MKRRNNLMLGAMLVILAKSSLAAPQVSLQLSEGLSRIGEQIYRILKSYYAVYGLMIVISIVMFRTLLLSVLKKVPIFQGEGAEGVSASGRIFATSAAFMIVLGLAMGYRNNTFVTRIGNLGTTPGTLLTLAIAGLYFFNARKNSDSMRKPLVWTAIIVFAGAIFFGSILWMVFFVLVIILIFSFGRGIGSGDGSGSPYSGGGGSGEKRLSRTRRWWNNAKDAFNDRLNMLREERGSISLAESETRVEEARLKNIEKSEEYMRELESHKRKDIKEIVEHMRAMGNKDFNFLRQKIERIYGLVLYQKGTLKNSLKFVGNSKNKEQKEISRLEKEKEKNLKRIHEKKKENIKEELEKPIYKLYSYLIKHRDNLIEKHKESVKMYDKLERLLHIQNTRLDPQIHTCRDLKEYLGKREKGDVKAGIKFTKRLQDLIQEEKQLNPEQLTKINHLTEELKIVENKILIMEKGLSSLYEKIELFEKKEEKKIEKVEHEAEREEKEEEKMEKEL